MAIEHLTDRDIQAYLDGTASADPAEIQRHLADCTVCRRQFVVYQRLYGNLAQETAFTLSPDFSSTVLARLQPASKKRAAYVDLLFMFFVLVISVASISYVLSQPSFETSLRAFFENGLTTLRAMSKFALSKSSGIFGSFQFPIFAAIILAVIGLIDRIFWHPRLRH